MIENLSIQIVEHFSPSYWRSVVLRDEVLRKPLGLHFEESELVAEGDSTHIVLGNGIVLYACLIMKPLSPQEVKMRQVAVLQAYQKQGFGKKLVSFAENWAKEKKFEFISLHARQEALHFYEKLDGYKRIGNSFEEVGIPHYKMIKNLV